MAAGTKLHPDEGDALIIVDVQRCFISGGTLAVHDGDSVVPVLNRYIALFHGRGLPIVATRDWHPPDHCSFTPQGGPWPPHCIAGTEDAAFAPGLELPDEMQVISGATEAEREAYSGFDGTDLAERLHGKGVRRLFIGGLATDYCVLYTVLDGLKEGFEVYLLLDAVRGVNVETGDDVRAIAKMQEGGAVTIGYEVLE